jgi:hypothetical protein
MPSKKQRINLSVPSEINVAIKTLAKRDEISATTKALELLEKGLQIEEDDIWEALAGSRDKKGAQYISHEKAWE